jgi:hypothetical protein
VRACLFVNCIWIVQHSLYFCWTKYICWKNVRNKWCFNQMEVSQRNPLNVGIYLLKQSHGSCLQKQGHGTQMKVAYIQSSWNATTTLQTDQFMVTKPLQLVLICQKQDLWSLYDACTQIKLYCTWNTKDCLVHLHRSVRSSQTEWNGASAFAAPRGSQVQFS